MGFLLLVVRLGERPSHRKRLRPDEVFLQRGMGWSKLGHAVKEYGEFSSAQLSSSHGHSNCAVII